MYVAEPMAFTAWLSDQYHRSDVVGALARYLLDQTPTAAYSISEWLAWLEQRPVDGLDDLVWWSFQMAEGDYQQYRSRAVPAHCLENERRKPLHTNGPPIG